MIHLLWLLLAVKEPPVYVPPVTPAPTCLNVECMEVK
jgi:hypothetical protein